MVDKVNILKAAFKTGVTLDLAFRKTQMHSFMKMIVDNTEVMCEALHKDLRKAKHESLMTEVHMIRKEVEYFLKSLDQLVIPEKVPKTFLTLTDATYILRQPYGVVLLLSAWNYPLLLTLQPLVGAIAAGNCVLVKPSELAPASEQLMAELLPKYLDPRCCQVMCGGPEETSELLKERFDYIFYTGSTRVGRIVQAAAAKFLTPTTLELGGKSPVYIDENCYIPMAAHRVAWGKCANTGQTCIAPDYVLCHAAVQAEFTKEVQNALKEFYGDNPALSPDLGRIINERNFDRLQQLLSDTKGKVVHTGEHNRDERYLAPTVVTDVPAEDSLMTEELFGPILPIVTVPSDEAAIDFINSKEKPLALYVFTNNRSVMNKFERRTFSGGLIHNDTVMHCAVKGLPFGGVGESGVGNYHGKFSYDTFTYPRAVLDKDTKEMFNNLCRYPPYTESKSSWMNWALSSGGATKNCSIM